MHYGKNRQNELPDVKRRMLRNSIPGMKELLDDDPPKGTTILVTGDAGTLKSAFVFSVMSGYIQKKPDEMGAYVTLDEKTESLIRNVKSIGIKCPKNLEIRDIAAFRTDFQTNSDIPVDSQMYFDQVLCILLENTQRPKKKKNDENDDGFPPGRITSCYALDSLNGFLAMAETDSFMGGDRSGRSYNLRNKLFALLSLLRENKAVNFIIFETTGEAYRPEFFLADGIIELGTIPYKGDMKRYIQVKKMKGMKHRLEKYLIDVTPKGLEVMGKIIP